MEIVVVYLADVGICNDYEWQVPQALDSMSQPGGKQRQGEVGRREEGLVGERWLAMSVDSQYMYSPFSMAEDAPDEICQCQGTTRQRSQSRDLMFRDGRARG